VDEVQRLPWILNEVHRFIEEKGLRFVLTGSNSRKLTRAGVNLLAGRALRRTMYPFLPEELGEDFDLEEVLRFGSLPIVWTSSSKTETLAACVQTYLKEAIQSEALVRNLPGFARFLPVAALFHGQVLNATSVARDAGVARTTVEDFLEILEETYVAFRLRAFEGRLRVREKRHPKLYWVDPGPALVNNLNLILKSPTGKTYVGNQPAAGSPTPDTSNNAEVIQVKNPTAGAWQLQVVASNVSQGPQDFALVCLGPF